MRQVTHRTDRLDTLSERDFSIRMVCLKMIDQKKEEVTITSTKKEKKEKHAFPVYNQKLAGFLMLQGYRLMGMEENKNYPWKNVFYFMESDRIHESIQRYFGNVR